ncbi:MAG TPA: Ig-like domain-containing protein [Longimicrobium sp.]
MVASLRRTTALGFLALLLTACSDDPAGPASVESVEVTSPAASIVAGQTMQLSIVLKDPSGNVLPGRAITWNSDNKAVATVSASGVVTALTPGSATITASAEEKVGRVALTIAPVPVATLTLSPNPVQVGVGLTTQLTLIARDAAGNELGGRPATLVTSNAAVAAIDGNRVVTGVSAGTATITATAEGKTTTATINVVPGPVTSVEVTPQNATIQSGASVQLTAVARDASGAAVGGRPITWTSANPAVASVSPTGMVTGSNPGGPVAITATVEGKSAMAQVTVIPVPIATLTLSPNPAEVRVGLTTQLTLIARDAAGNELGGRTVTLVTSNAAVAAIDANRMVTGMSAGTATITATAEGKTATATVNVVPGPVTSVEVTPQNATIQSGASVQLTAIARDASGAAVGGRPITWTSADPAVASVSATGLVTGSNPGGPVAITATVEGKSAMAQVTVIPVPIATLTLSPNPAEVRVGLTTQLTLIARDAAGNELGGRTATLVTSNAAVATIDGNRVVTGVSAGTATITATAEGKTATATINVVPGPVASVEVTPQNLQLRENAWRQFTATTRDASGAVVTGRPVTWSSSNEAVATVSTSGLSNGTALVSGVSAGTATITATSEGKSGSTTVTVLRAQVTSIRFAPFPDPFIVGDTVRARATAVDSVGRELPDRTVTYSGSNDAVATVSPSGLMGGVSAGSVTVTATSEGVSGTQTGSVVDVYPSFDALTCQAVKVGATCTASARIRYTANGNGFPGARTIVFTSSDPGIARVAQPSTSQSTSQTATITGVSPGTVTLTATYVGANGVTRSRTMQFRVDP